MHEMSVATALVSQVCDHAAAVSGPGTGKAPGVAEISVRMGVLSAITRSLYFCFPHAARGTACEGATLVIDEVPLSVMCRHCDGVKYPKGLFNFRCPDCGFPTPKVLTGREMQLVSITMRTADERSPGSVDPRRQAGISPAA